MKHPLSLMHREVRIRTAGVGRRVSEAVEIGEFEIGGSRHGCEVDWRRLQSPIRHDRDARPAKRGGVLAIDREHRFIRALVESVGVPGDADSRRDTDATVVADSCAGHVRRADVAPRWREGSVPCFPRPPVEHRVRPVRHAGHRSRIVQARGVPLSGHRRRIDECVGAVPADDSDGNALLHMTRHERRVVAAVQVDEDLRRLARVEASSKERRSSRLEADVDHAIALRA